MIFNFSEELSGTYSCGYSYHIINQTLRLLEEGIIIIGALSISCIIILGWGHSDMGYM